MGGGGGVSFSSGKNGSEGYYILQRQLVQRNLIDNCTIGAPH